MLPLMLGLWKARRGRKAAVAIIAPFVARSRNRLNGIPEQAWLDPYMAGFMIMLITLVARRAVSILDSHALGLVQCEAWAEITGMKSVLIGEETLHLSATGHKTFELGCRNAIAFDLALYGTSMAGVAAVPLEGVDGALDRCVNDAETSLHESGDISALWGHYFDGHMMDFAGNSQKEAIISRSPIIEGTS